MAPSKGSVLARSLRIASGRHGNDGTRPFERSEHRSFLLSCQFLARDLIAFDELVMRHAPSMPHFDRTLLVRPVVRTFVYVYRFSLPLNKSTATCPGS